MFEIFDAQTDETIVSGIATLSAALERARKEFERRGTPIAIDGPSVSMVIDGNSRG